MPDTLIPHPTSNITHLTSHITHPQLILTIAESFTAMSRLPEPLIDSLANAPGFDKDPFVRVHANQDQIVSVRFNPAKINAVQGVESLTVTNGHHPPVPWCSTGYYLAERPSFTFDPHFHAGVYYVQEASSMFIEQALRQTLHLHEPLTVLDLCAAPGGKSTLIQSLLSPQSVLVSNEVIKSRALILEENCTKWGGANVIVTNNDPKDLARLNNMFDAIMIDAPCSGSGLFRRDPEAINEWSEANVELCSQRQQRIIADIWPALKPGGVLIYSTCSYSVQEDEEIADWLMQEFPVSSIPLATDAGWNIIETRSPARDAYGYRFWPDRVKGEGFFIACFRKEEGAPTQKKTVKKGKAEKVSRNEEALIRPWLTEKYDGLFLKYGDGVLALSERLLEALNEISSANLYVRVAGIRLGKIAGRELLPDHALAMSALIAPDVVAASLKYEQAIQYLRRDEVEIDVKNHATGWTLMQFAGINLGWAKILSNRINNYYPKEWRILKRTP
jgi:16S rRNA C967 or C1407 C5-methylase (RsmB/RsmF family)/NOL1/NOP2/fmu family ribosome biogenesis protein